MIMKRNTKIVATIGPSSQDEGNMFTLIEAGIDIARINFSHGDHGTHKTMIKRLRRLAHTIGQPLCIMQDLQGLKIRTGEIENGSVELVNDQQLVLTSEPLIGNKNIVSVDFVEFPKYVNQSSGILLDDGNTSVRTK
jgi:pyruvate kinase